MSMNDLNGLKIGDLVRYIRVDAVRGEKDPADMFGQGEARFKGVGVDHNGRALVLLENQDMKSFNTPLACINPTDAFSTQFKRMVTNVNEITKLANEEMAKVKDSAEQRIGEEESAILGLPVWPISGTVEE